MAIVLRIGDKNVLLEKNHVVTIDTTYKTSNETEICDVPYAINSTTLNNMLTKAVDTFGKEKIHRYSSFTNNCQMFVKDVLTANSLYNDTINTFVYQDFKEARDTLPITNTIANTVTDIVNVANKLSGGSKKEDEHVRELINKIHANYASRYVVGSGINPNVKKGFLDFVHGFLLPFKTIGSIIPEIGLPLQMAAGALDKIIPRGSGLSKRVKKVKI
jgi:hypothetical protein